MAAVELAVKLPRRHWLADAVRRHPTVAAGLLILLAMGAVAGLAPWLGTSDPLTVSPIRRLRFPAAAYWFGTDAYGRDVYSRTLYGARVSLQVGLGVAVLSTALGLAIGLVTGFSRLADGVLMRVMDGLMAVPPVLLAIALMALTRGSVQNVIIAITIPNVPQVARLVRGAVVPALENVALWHERDISHSAVERVIAPDTTIALDFALARLAGLIERLVVYPDRMRANLESLGGVVHSGEVLLALTRAGLAREEAYRIVQRNAMVTWDKLGTPEGRDFRANLLADPEAAGRVPAAVIDAAMDPGMHLKELDAIFLRVFGEPGPAPGAS